MANHDHHKLRQARINEVRFAPSGESLKMIRELKQILPDMQVRYPEVKGLGFFGSRTLGTERPDSDLDTVVYFNSSDIPDGLGRTRVMFTFDKAPIKRFETLNQELRNELRRFNVGDSTVVGIDIAPEVATPFIKAFANAVDSNDLDADPAKQKLDFFKAAAAYLGAYFYLATGHEVYRARKLILDTWASLPNGDKYFSALMTHLEHNERFKHPQTGLLKLPHTIVEAKEYFLTE